MARSVEAASQAPSFDYELYEGDPDHLRTVVATSAQTGPWIDPASLKLKHRIGRGPFGDMWLATHHQSGDDYDRYHEVAIKMLHPMKDDDVKRVLDKFEELFMKLRQLQGVCWLHGISIISGTICVAMKFYKGSVGDRMAHLKGGKLSLPDVMRYGIELAKGIQELHSIGVLLLNLKPTNFLLDEHDQVTIGDFGIPWLLLGVQLLDSDFALRLGTPNYMAPEQWEPDVRGPITIETDTWGFGCSIVEMLTGAQPWFGKSVQEIYNLVVIKQQRPQLPSGLPPAIENVVNGCFEYDLRNRPLMADILHAFESSRNAVYNDGEWIGLGSRILLDKSTSSSSSCYSTWFLSKDRLQVGDTVRSRKDFNSDKPQALAVTEGTIVGLEKDTDRDGFVLTRIQGILNPLRLSASKLERVASGFAAGDWVGLMEENNNHSTVGILHTIDRDGFVAIGFIGLETLWKGHCSQLQMVEPYFVGQFVRLKGNVFAPRFEWPYKRGASWATGRISQILPNGCLVVKFPGWFVFKDEQGDFLADPGEVERVSFETCPRVVDKYQHLEDFHWAVRPLAVAFGIFTVMKVGTFVGQSVGAKVKGRRNRISGGDKECQNDQSGGNVGWQRSKVANMIFKKDGGGPTIAAAR